MVNEVADTAVCLCGCTLVADDEGLVCPECKRRYDE
jgi:hypothetical protein